MSNKIKSLFCVVLIVFSCIFISCSDSTPELDISKAKRNLKGNDYSISTDEEMLGSDIIVEEALFAESDDGEDFIFIIEFDSVTSAKKYYKAFVEEKKREEEIKYYDYVIDNYKKELEDEDLDSFKEDKKEAEEYLKKMRNGRKGKYMWLGTVDAIEDSKG